MMILTTFSISDMWHCFNELYGPRVWIYIYRRLNAGHKASEATIQSSGCLQVNYSLEWNEARNKMTGVVLFNVARRRGVFSECTPNKRFRSGTRITVGLLH